MEWLFRLLLDIHELLIHVETVVDRSGAMSKKEQGGQFTTARQSSQFGSFFLQITYHEHLTNTSKRVRLWMVFRLLKGFRPIGAEYGSSALRIRLMQTFKTMLNRTGSK